MGASLARQVFDQSAEGFFQPLQMEGRDGETTTFIPPKVHVDRPPHLDMDFFVDQLQASLREQGLRVRVQALHADPQGVNSDQAEIIFHHEKDGISSTSPDYNRYSPSMLPSLAAPTPDKVTMDQIYADYSMEDVNKAVETIYNTEEDSVAIRLRLESLKQSLENAGVDESIINAIDATPDGLSDGVEKFRPEGLQHGF